VRDIDAALGQQLQHLATGERIGQIPANGGQDDVGGPAVAMESGRAGLGEYASARAARVLLPATRTAAVCASRRVAGTSDKGASAAYATALSEFPDSRQVLSFRT
jgi:hypothetical protein